MSSLELLSWQVHPPHLLQGDHQRRTREGPRRAPQQLARVGASRLQHFWVGLMRESVQLIYLISFYYILLPYLLFMVYFIWFDLI
jgi:hypothetical protein